MCAYAKKCSVAPSFAMFVQTIVKIAFKKVMQSVSELLFSAKM